MPARLVWLGLEREAIVVSLIDAVLGEEVDTFAKALDGIDRILRCVGFDAFAPAPIDPELGAQRRGIIHRLHRLLHGVGADLGVVAGERAVFENRIGK